MQAMGCSAYLQFSSHGRHSATALKNPVASALSAINPRKADKMSSSDCQKACFLVELRAPLCLTSLSVNPGTGGTEFTDISLAIQYAYLIPSASVHILTTAPIGIAADLKPGNLTIIVLKAFSELQGEKVIEAILKGSALIAPQSILERLSSTFLREHAHRTIATIRHPYARSKLLRDANLAYYVAVGSFQYTTIAGFYPRTLFIQNACNLSFSPASKDLPGIGRDANVRFVYLGALTPGKGLHHILSQWTDLSRKFPLATLDVVGGSETYGIKATHPIIPTTREYGETLEQLLKGDYERVRFHGNLGAEKESILDRSHLALLNPTGRTEAFPASPLQCMAKGIPVVASGRLGMRDCMQYFPELRVSRPSEIVSKVEYALGSAVIYQDLSRRSHRVAKFFSNATGESVLRWKGVVEAVLCGRRGSLSFCPSELRPEEAIADLETSALVRLVKGRVWERIAKKIRR